MTDTDRFPHPVYKDTVLAPLFEGVKTHYAAHMMAINKAHLVMLHGENILDTNDAKQIAHSLIRIETETDPDTLTYTGEHEDYFFFVEAELKRHLGDLGGALHTARSRNDMDHTLFKLALQSRTEGLISQLHALGVAMLDKAQVEKTTLITAWTHGQPAQPTTFGHYLAAALEVLLRDITRLEAAAEGLDHCPMGAAAITTSGFPINRARMAELLGFSEPLLNSYGCIASVDYVTGLYSAIKLTFLHLGRLIQDMQFWSAFEVGQLHVPGALVQISSIMPQKRNPVPIEHMRHLASMTCGRSEAVITTMHNTPFTDMNDSEGEVQQGGYAAFDSAMRCASLLSAFIPAVTINGDRVRANMNAACVTITELADTLVRDEALTFREAHEIAAIVAKDVIAMGQGLEAGYDAFTTAFCKQTGRETALGQQAFLDAVSPEGFVARRDRPGGPALPALDAAFEIYNRQQAALQLSQNARLTRRSRSAAALNAAFNTLTEV
ncbi:argininosuccinate lyase [Halocynthiibacter sp.]|uniref:argininosuccinate lyase n=1 Tax=Halocynthiibacter sp. TaxID=1979210 RepID=UPI003C401B31